MAKRSEDLFARLSEMFAGQAEIKYEYDEVTLTVDSARYLETCELLVERQDLLFEQMIDLCGVDYAAYGRDEWESSDVAMSSGFSRAASRDTAGQGSVVDAESISASGRFAVVVHLLSVTHNWRLRLKTFAPVDELPVVPSITSIWAVANWFEREAFDMFGVVFDGHPDMRRLLTDYGFIGHPFRKDFPLTGNVEVKYDEAQKRVIYQPVSIEPRTLVPRVIRHDSRYAKAKTPEGQ